MAARPRRNLWARDWDDLRASGKPRRAYRAVRLGSPRTQYVTSGRRHLLTFGTKTFASVRYVKVGKNGPRGLKSHKDYLQRELAKLLGPHVPATFGCPLANNPKALSNEANYYKIVVSPENIWGLDPETYVRALMQRLAVAMGVVRGESDLAWQAHHHTDTASPHYHVYLRGATISGQQIRIPKQVIKNIRHIANDLAKVMGSYSQATSLDRSEFDAARRLDPMKPHLGISLDRFLFGLPGGSLYHEALQWLPITQRRACHARFIFLRQNGIISIDKEGHIAQVPGSVEKLQNLKAKRDELLALGPLRFARREEASFQSETAKPAYGLITSFRKSPVDGGCWAILETITDRAVMVNIRPSELPRLANLADQGTVLKLSKGEFTSMTGDPKKRLKKLRAKGGVVTAIMDDAIIVADRYLSSPTQSQLDHDKKPRRRPDSGLEL